MRFLLLTALGAICLGCATSSAPPTVPQPQAQQQERQKPKQKRQESATTSSASSSDRKQEQPSSAAEQPAAQSQSQSEPSSQSQARESAGPSEPPRPTGGAPDPDLVERTRADQAALDQAEADYRQRRASGSLDAAEAGDYAAYVAGLQRRVVEDCVELESSGAELPADLRCKTMVTGLPSTPHAVDPQAVNTGAERTAELDAEFQASLGEFDEILIREQDTVDAGTAEAFGEEGSDGAGGQGSNGDGEEGSGGQGRGQGQDAQASAGGEGSHEDRNEQSQRGKGGQGGVGSPGGQGAPSQTGDLPDGSDDDVVARQLREAAEKETDPELKKRLWEEYRKYKQGTT